MSNVTLEQIIHLIDQLKPAERAALVKRLKEPAEEKAEDTGPLNEREIVRAKLLAAGFLVIHPVELTDEEMAVEPYTDDELDEVGHMPPGAPTSEQLVDEDRGAY